MADTWTEVNVNSEGVSVTIYEDTAPDATVVEEFWMTHDEFEDADNHGSYVLEHE